MSRIKESAPMPLILIGNKSDKEAEREVSISDGKRLATGLRCPFLETSAKLSINVEEAFIELTRQIQFARGEVQERSRIHGPPASSSPPIVEQVTPDTQSKSRQSSSHAPANGKGRGSTATGGSGKSAFSTKLCNNSLSSTDKRKKKDCIVM
jgi:hypothetical protein